MWQELTRDTDGEIKMIRVEDFGTARTTRRSRNLDNNKQEQNLEVASSRTEPTLYEQDQAKMKMTSPKKVKTEHSNRRQKPTVESPSLKRLQTPKFDKIAPGTSPTRQKLRNSQFKTQNFKQLLIKWEDISTISLTPAVHRKPRSNNFVDSQPDDVLQKKMVKKLKMLGQPSLDAKIDSRGESGSTANEKPSQKIVRKFGKLSKKC